MHRPRVRRDRPPEDAVGLRPTARRGVGRVVGLGLTLGALAGLTVTVDAEILFAADTAVPRAVQAFAWNVIETRCNYQAYERSQRSFWAYDAQAKKGDAGVVYSITVLSDVTWRKTEPPATIEMTLVDDGRLRLTALKSSFITCTR